MNRFPHQILVEKTDSNYNPYSEVSFQEVYTGDCRCFCNGKAAYRSAKCESNDYEVVIPDPVMVDIGEGSKVTISNYRMNGVPLVGYVVDFMRYDRVCNLFFRLAKGAIEGE